jgi:hypothetical protein
VSPSIRAIPVSSAEPLIVPTVPTISRFYGIVITMYYRDHPPPHIHVRYGEYQGRIAYRSGEVLTGELPVASFGWSVVEWCGLRQDELDANWDRARSKLPLTKIEPLQ